MDIFTRNGVIALDHFIEATRDAGYKGTASALAELIDNSLEASAARIDIQLLELGRELKVVVGDNGDGMRPSTLQLALQFGGSTRFNSRKGLGRYGMGLPNSSLSRARHVDVYSWTTPKAVWWSYLDVDEIVASRMSFVPKPIRIKRSTLPFRLHSSSGTVVIWSKCDRLDYKKKRTLVAKLHDIIGRIYRYQIWGGKTITINGKLVQPIDPLFQREGNNLIGAAPFGPPLQFNVETLIPNSTLQRSVVTVVFSELPIEKWHGYSSEEKRTYGISKGAGISVVRANREIDVGWYFMGTKRKENYDDWWRCEIRFTPELDEWFGVTHTKQGIHPTEAMKDILTPDMERLARILNQRARKKYSKVRNESDWTSSRFVAEKRDHLLEPPLIATSVSHIRRALKTLEPSMTLHRHNQTVPGLSYKIEHKALSHSNFFEPVLRDRELVVLLNEAHPFYERVYAPLINSPNADARHVFQYLELLILAVARAECSLDSSDVQKDILSLREAWSRNLAAFLG